MRAVCRIKEALEYRRASFIKGLRAAGYTIVDAINEPQPADVLVIWNRMGAGHEEAKRFERAGARVIVAENGYMGRKWRGAEWFAMGIGHHNGAGVWPNRGSARWDSWDVPLAPWREGGDEVVLLPQRGIGEPGVAMPSTWPRDAQKIIGKCRVRAHPGEKGAGPTLEEDLKRAKCVAVWASGAGIKALAMGIPVFYSFDKWIAAGACRPLKEWAAGPLRDDGARLTMFRRLAWANWSMAEIETGEAFNSLLTP